MQATCVKTLYTCSDRSIFACYGTHTMNYLRLWGFYASGTQDAKVTKPLLIGAGSPPKYLGYSL